MHVGLVVAGDIETGSGGFYYDRRLVDRLRSRNHEVTVVSLPWGSYGRQLAENVRGGRTLWNRDFDLVIEDGLAHPSLLLANRRIEVPVVALCHMLRTMAATRRYRPLVEAVERRFLESVDAAIYNSESTRNIARTLSVPKAETVVPPGSDRYDAEITEAEIRERAEANRVELLFLGNVVERKGLDTLVEGLASLTTEWQLTVIGETSIDRSYVESVRSRIREYGIVDRVDFTGRLPDSEVESRFEKAHVLAVPSRYEPFGMAHLESMGFGCIPLATTNGGPSEFISDDESGLLVPPDDPKAITARLEHVADRDRLAFLGVAAKEAFDRQPTWEERLDRAVDFLEAQCPDT